MNEHRTTIDALAFQALTGMLVVCGSEVADVTVQISAMSAAGRDKLAAVLAEALAVDVESVRYGRFIASGGVLIEISSEEE